MDDILSRSAAFARAVIEGASRDRLPELFRDDAGRSIHRVSERGGISVVVLRGTALNPEQLLAICRYRLAQYLTIGFVDPVRVYSAGWQHEPLEHLRDDDVHILVGSSRTGEILCYATIQAAVEPSLDATLYTHNRPLLPVEQLFDQGIFNHLQLLTNRPLSRIRELKRFVKNQHLDSRSELAVRAPIEVGAAVFHTLVGPLAEEVDAIVGDIDERGARRNLDYFDVPLVILHAARLSTIPDDYLYPHWIRDLCVPFAFWIEDLLGARPRVAAIEEALAKPDLCALRRLFKHDGVHRPSSLIRKDGYSRKSIPTSAEMGCGNLCSGRPAASAGCRLD